MTKRTFSLVLLWLSFAQAPTPADALGERGGAHALSDRERYLDLLKRKDRIDKLAELLKIEASLSAKKKTYLVLDLSDRKIYFKVRGRTLKAIPFNSIDASHRSGRIDPSEVAGRVYMLELKEGKGVETESISLKSLTPEEAASAGATDVDAPAASVEQGEVVSGADLPAKKAGTGAPPILQKTQGVAGGAIPPDPPSRYHMGFDGQLSIWVSADEAAAPKNPLYEKMLPLARSLGRLLGKSDGGEEGTRVNLHVTLDHGQQIFRQVICGQQLLIAP